MVSNMQKATAISRLKLGDSPLELSADLGLPTMLVREWQENLDIKDLVSLQATTHAISRVANSSTTLKEDCVATLQSKIERVAIEIVEQVSLSVVIPEPSRAKALQLLANTCATLYNTIVNKGAAPSTADTTVTLFQQFSRD